jgi:sugar/nucleoside kinase (ribokinase family)
MPLFDVTIAGELNLDLILYGLPEALPLERELLARGMMLTLGSSSAIVAHNLAALGCRVGFQSKIGADELGSIALERLAQGGVDVSRVLRPQNGPQTGLTVIVQREKLRNILTYPGTIFELRIEDLDFEYLTSARHFHLSSYFLQRGLTAQIPEIFRRIKAAGLTVSLDTNDDPDDLWGGGLHEALRCVDVFLPNAREAQRITGARDVESAMEELARQVPLVVVKLGEAGAMAQRGRERTTSPALRVDVVDPVGAGDSFDAGFLSQYVHGADLETCLAWGNRAGAFSTTRPGGTEAFRDRERQREFWLQTPL